MIIPGKYQPNNISILKIVRISEDEAEVINSRSESQKLAESMDKKSNLEVLGMGPSGDVLFKYENQKQNISQTFGVNLKYYAGHMKEDIKIDEKKRMKTHEEDLQTSDTEGVYSFKT